MIINGINLALFHFFNMHKRLSPIPQNNYVKHVRFCSQVTINQQLLFHFTILREFLLLLVSRSTGYTLVFRILNLSSWLQFIAANANIE